MRRDQFQADDPGDDDADKEEACQRCGLTGVSEAYAPSPLVAQVATARLAAVNAAFKGIWT